MPPLAAVAANCSAEGNAITGKFIAQHVKSSFVITARGADNLQCGAGGVSDTAHGMGGQGYHFGVVMVALLFPAASVRRAAQDLLHAVDYSR